MDIKIWMSKEMLKLNDDKTEVLYITSPYFQKSLPNPTLKINQSSIAPQCLPPDGDRLLSPICLVWRTACWDWEIVRGSRGGRYDAHNTFKMAMCEDVEIYKIFAKSNVSVNNVFQFK